MSTIVKGRLVLTQVVLGVVLAATAGLLALYFHSHAIQEATRALQSLSLVLAEQAGRSFEAVKLVQDGIVEKLNDAQIRTPDEFRARMAGLAIHEDLVSRIKGLPELDAITAIDVEGNLINFSRYWPIPKVNVSDRDYFKALGSSAQQNTFISEPVPNRGNGSWTVYVARRVSSPDGGFLGLILAGVELKYFEQLYGTVAPSSAHFISLFREDGILLARYPHPQSAIGQSSAAHKLFQEIRATPGPSTLVREAIGTPDGQERFIAVHRIENYPLLVTVSTTVNALLGEWYRQTIYLICITMFFEIFIVFAGRLMVSQLRSHALLNQVLVAKAHAETQARLAAEDTLNLAQDRARVMHERDVQSLRFSVAMNNMPIGLVMFDADDRLILANEGLVNMLGLPETAICADSSLQAFLAMARATSRKPATDIAVIANSIQALRATGVDASCVSELLDGRAISIVFRPVGDDGWLATLDDITERRQADARIVHMAHHDALTGLPNRIRFHQALNQAMIRARSGARFGILCIDLDQFKAVNDTLGHPVGDLLLKAVAERLQRDVFETDVVARLGGDEFAVIQSSIASPTDVSALADRLIAVLSEPFHINHHCLTIGASIGTAIGPDDGTDPDLILRNADMALYRAKADGRGRCRCFTPAMDAMMQARRSLELDLRAALAAEEFQLFYQPIMSLDAGVVSGFEALIRWQHPQRGMIPPSEFIPLAEEIGLIVPLGFWVLRQACAEAMLWPRPVRVAVNLSVVQFAHPFLVQEVIGALQGSGLSPDRLELEITESVMIEDTERALGCLRSLRALGVRIALDDFGTGYSSISYLRRFLFDKVKIDRSFTHGLGREGDSEAIIETIIGLCKRLGMTTTVEGIETFEQLCCLKRLQCTELQGYLFSKPRPATEAASLCQNLRLPEGAALIGHADAA